MDLALAGRILSVQFHGNHSVTDDELLRMSGISIGSELTAVEEQAIKERLLQSKRFESVGVERRYRSLAASGDIILLVSVQERVPVKKKVMFFPVLSGSDEYGLEYGARMTVIDLLGKKERISTTGTWGGVRRAAVALQFNPKHWLSDSVQIGGGMSRKVNPHFETSDLRSEMSVELTKSFRRFRTGGHAGWSGVRFGSLSESFWSYGGKIAFDTRGEINFPRDAVYMGLGWDRLRFQTIEPTVNRFKVDVRAFKGLGTQTILAGQVVYDHADHPLPEYEQYLLGGSSSVRGHPPGEFVGNDRRLLTSLELRIPVNSPMSVHRTGFTIFFDSGTALHGGATLKDADFKHGVGAGVFLFVAGLGFRLDVAHDLNRRLRVHFATGFRF